MTRTILLAMAAIATLEAQVTPMDNVFAGLSARTTQLAYQQRGGDMAAIAPLMSQATNSDRVLAYRALTHASMVMNGRAWTPDNELATGLDFAIHAKVIGTGENLATHATFLFDAPAAAQGHYRLQLDLLKANGDKEATVDPGIVLGDVRGRRGGETIGLTFDPSKLVQPGLHLLRATLQDGHGTAIFQYHRSFFIVPDLTKRLDAAEKTLELLPDQRMVAALTARQLLETVARAHQSYYGTGFQNLTGYVYAAMRTAGLGTTEPLDFDDALTRATKLATSLKEGQDPFADPRGDVGMAYRSSFDGQLVPYRIYVPRNYDKSRKYPLIVLLHGAGGDETNFLEGYQALFPKFAEERGYILASVNGRGPLSGYRQENGGEQDVLDVLDLMKVRFNIDSSRTYLGGHSMGGGGTWTVGLKHRDRFSGLIPIAGTSAVLAPNLEAQMKSGKKLPVLVVCGVKDALVAVAGCRTVAEKAKSLDAPLTYKEYPDGDHLSVVPMAVPDIYNWLDAEAGKK